MATYLMFGNYSPAKMGEISSGRTEGATAIIGDCGGKLVGGYVMLGEKDLVLIVKFPGVEEVIKASMALSLSLGITFTTAPALSIADFDKLVGA